jgi:hypothetical protein
VPVHPLQLPPAQDSASIPLKTSAKVKSVSLFDTDEVDKCSKREKVRRNKKKRLHKHKG